MSILKLIFIDIILDLFYFPLWWYSRGLLLTLRWAVRQIAEIENFLGLRIWLANIFRPMYGQQDLGGKVISFFMRLFQIILRAVLLMAASIFHLFAVVVYLFLPIGAVYGILLHARAFY